MGSVEVERLFSWETGGGGGSESRVIQTASAGPLLPHRRPRPRTERPRADCDPLPCAVT